MSRQKCGLLLVCGEATNLPSHCCHFKRTITRPCWYTWKPQICPVTCCWIKRIITKLLSLYLALKKCRWGTPGTGTENILTPKHVERWEKEVEIMNRLSHSAVVKCFQVPPELMGPPGDLPMLCMEYCSGGDLRKVLPYSISTFQALPFLFIFSLQRRLLKGR